MIVWFNHLQLAIIFGKKFFDVFRGLVVHYVQFWFEPLLFQFNKIHLICSEYAHVVQTCNGFGEDGVGFVMVQDEKTNAPVEGHEWKRSR